MEEHNKLDEKEHSSEHKRHRKEKVLSKPILTLMTVAAIVILINQMQIFGVYAMLNSDSDAEQLTLGGNKGNPARVISSGEKDLANIDLAQLKSTGHTIATVFPVEDIVTQEDAMAILFPIGTPDYGEDLGVSYDDPVTSLGVLAKMYRGLKAEVEKNNPEGFQRFMSLASLPVGISCEYCCGLKAIGIDKNGNSACGCQHNPALLSVAMYLSAYSDYTDGEILQEVMKWKTLFFPRDMIELGMTVAGGDTSQLEELPGMVGGC